MIPASRPRWFSVLVGWAETNSLTCVAQAALAARITCYCAVGWLAERLKRVSIQAVKQLVVGTRLDEKVMQQKWTKQAKVGEISQ
jgi:hypothetical protein